LTRSQRLLDPRSGRGAKTPHSKQAGYLNGVIASHSAQLHKRNVLDLANIIFAGREARPRPSFRRFSTDPRKGLPIAIPCCVVTRPHQLHDPIANHSAGPLETMSARDTLNQNGFGNRGLRRQDVFDDGPQDAVVLRVVKPVRVDQVREWLKIREPVATVLWRSAPRRDTPGKHLHRLRRNLDQVALRVQMFKFNLRLPRRGRQIPARIFIRGLGLESFIAIGLKYGLKG
jgi:hypothetical protein